MDWIIQRFTRWIAACRDKVRAMLDIGTRLGPYEVTGRLGSGGMGEVYRARDTRLNRTVAIKVLPKHLADRPDSRERFEREAKAIAALNHPHICILYDTGIQDGTLFLVMECVEGETLADRLTRGPIPFSQALDYAIQIADALDKAHGQGITHRDLKPGNIMLTKSGVKLLDFGLAKLASDQTASHAGLLSAMPTAQGGLTVEGAILGTPQYMAPEQLEGREADARTDIFAFGTVVYEMIAGKRAFEAKSQASCGHPKSRIRSPSALRSAATSGRRTVAVRRLRQWPPLLISVRAPDTAPHTITIGLNWPASLKKQ